MLSKKDEVMANLSRHIKGLIKGGLEQLMKDKIVIIDSLQVTADKTGELTDQFVVNIIFSTQPRTTPPSV